MIHKNTQMMLKYYSNTVEIKSDNALLEDSLNESTEIQKYQMYRRKEQI